jgi:hypothetical protein
MIETEVEPLFRPGESIIAKSRFICNIGGELSLWNVGDPPELRIYGANSYGLWLESEEAVERHIARTGSYISTQTIVDPQSDLYYSKINNALARNHETVLVYMRMLKGAEP